VTLVAGSAVRASWCLPEVCLRPGKSVSILAAVSCALCEHADDVGCITVAVSSAVTSVLCPGIASADLHRVSLWLLSDRATLRPMVCVL
jgi:hypothetical protein